VHVLVRFRAPTRLRYADFLEALKRSPAMEPFVHDLRVLLHPSSAIARGYIKLSRAGRALPCAAVTSRLARSVADSLQDVTPADVEVAIVEESAEVLLCIATDEYAASEYGTARIANDVDACPQEYAFGHFVSLADGHSSAFDTSIA
jgi:hypothetical protein